MNSPTFYIKLYFLTFLVFLGIDAVWLGIIAKNLYSSKIGHLMTDNPNLLAAFVFYALNIIGIIVFAVNPGLAKNSIQTTLMYGALYGLLTYATYDLTNLATLRDWPLSVTIIDLIWGTVLSATVACAGYLIATRII